MKRALTAAVFGGLMAVVVPQAAFADPVGYELAGHDGGHEATHPEGEGPQPDNAPPAPYGDREQHDDEDDTSLF